MPTEVASDALALSCGRRERALAQMEAHDLDVLVLGRQANVRYLTGTPQRWMAGTRSFAPNCVLVRATGAVHLLRSSEQRVPEDIPRDHLNEVSWNPTNIIAALAHLDGAMAARRVGTDAMSPLFAQLLPLAFPQAELVDGEPAMRAARSIKTAEEVAALRTAVAIAASALAAAAVAVDDGVSEQTLAGVLMEAMSAGGAATPANQDVVWVTSREYPWRRAGGGGRVRAGDLVAISAAVLAGGYLGEVGRTFAVGGSSDNSTAALYRRWDGLWKKLSGACRPGASGSALLSAYADAGEPLPPVPVAHGLGLGFDPPVVSAHLPQTAASGRLEPGMVLAVTGYVFEPGVGAVFGREAVLITEDDHEVLTTSTSS
ncbi:M24 family metallopeptidase [[Mycobacterium] holstebronense]|uniref:M24 family metallopeptidase n=1 Tax=[Mycobacterium] holstebronense TaxID=3064288 RepID=A0ABN9NMD1_9MYCO|nr:M24 family metallopeptidase [Mycolicibacter sp. MU0102]CAJ1508978.1 M24 family metallopeptidase [Mycolicibacter sp. MU0102]